jgi:hypothetical protein
MEFDHHSTARSVKPGSFEVLSVESPTDFPRMKSCVSFSMRTCMEGPGFTHRAMHFFALAFSSWASG